jgi:hypothetical protein
MSYAFMSLLAQTIDGCIILILHFKYGPEGYRSRCCGCAEYRSISTRTRMLVCARCGAQESITSNTVFEGLRLPLQVLVGAWIDYKYHGQRNASEMARKYNQWPSTMLRLLDRFREVLDCLQEEVKETLQSVPVEAPPFKRVLSMRSIESGAKVLAKNVGGGRVLKKLVAKLKKTERRAQEWYDRLNPSEKAPIVELGKYYRHNYHNVSKRKARKYGAEFNFRGGRLGSIESVMTFFMRSAPKKRVGQSDDGLSADRSDGFVLLPLPAA